MAREFNGTNQYLQIDAVPLSTAPCGMVGWFRSDSISSTQAVLSLCNSGANQQQRNLRVFGAQPGDPVTAVERGDAGGAERAAFSATGYTADTWHHGAALFRDANYRKAYIDTVAGTANTDNVGTITFNRTNIGRWGRSTATNYFNGELAEVALFDLQNWGASASAREAAWDRAVEAMGKGVRPIRFPIGLVGYWPLWGDHSPEIDCHPRSNNASDFSMAVTGAVKATRHAPIELRTRPPAPLFVAPVYPSSQGIALAQLKKLLAQSETFRSAVGGTEADVNNHVHFGRQVGTPPRPHAIIELESGDGNAISFGEGNQIIASGGLVVRLERDADLTQHDPYYDALDWFGHVLDEVNDLAGHGDDTTEFNQTHLALLTAQLRVVGENDRSTWHSLGRFFSAETLWTWGDA